MSSFEFEQSEAMEGSSAKISKPGTYHLIVTNVDPEPVSTNDKPINGLRVEGEVLEGTQASEVGKQFEFILFRPKPTDNNNGEFAKRRLTRLAYALGFMSSHAPGQKLSIDCEASAGRQFVAKFHEEEENDGKKYIKLCFSDIYHVDDPAVANVPKSQSALVAIPANLRKSLPAPPANGNGNGNGGNGKASKQLATAGGPSLDDI